MATGSGDDNFDWVTAQAGCSVEQMFQKLQDGARADVERRNGATFGRKDDWRFEFHEDEGEGFEVVRIGGSSKGAHVTFVREGTRIEISGDGVDVQITAIVGINPHGDCRYYVGEIEYLGWEVRKQALDLLFFEEVADYD
jgi:hypothetical protein